MGSSPPLVFVVDDDASVRKALRRVLQNHGIITETYASAEDFLDLTLGRRSGCLILDAHLPGMSGIELHSRLLAANCDMRVLFISGDLNEGLRKKALMQGAIGFLSK